MTDYMDVNEVLEEIHELGFFSYDKTVNHGYPKIIAPKFTVHVDRLGLFYKFMLEYINSSYFSCDKFFERKSGRTYAISRKSSPRLTPS